jgi:hypothetical protein
VFTHNFSLLPLAPTCYWGDRVVCWYAGVQVQSLAELRLGLLVSFISLACCGLVLATSMWSRQAQARPRGACLVLAQACRLGSVGLA